MTSLDPAARSDSSAAATLTWRFAPAVFAATLFTSALLLFAVQPMFTKMVLPLLGGAPSVWSVAMVVFQAALLLGYAYAHLIAHLLGPARAAMVHIGVLALAAATLPIGIASGFDAPPQSGVTLWLVALIGASVGLPFAALSASAPLLQSWFAGTDHPQAHNPYVLYAASNLGSFAALIAYPFAIEPLLSLSVQARVWSIGFGLLAALVAGCALFALKGSPANRIARESAPPATATQRIAWIGLAAIPAGLVVAVTAYITTDVAAAPFLWVLPLALYLLTFVAVFRERAWIPHEKVLLAVPFTVAPLAISLMGGDKVFFFVSILLNLAAFAALALACHGELYRRRPAPARLTEFYLWTSLGGVIGGIFAGLVAPHVFSGTYEYPILIAAALLVLPGTLTSGLWHFWREAGVPLAIAAALVAPKFLLDVALPFSAQLSVQIVLIVLALIMLLQRRRPARFFGLVAVAFVLTEFWQPGLNRIEQARSFFGVHKVIETADGRFRLLIHGTTIHGAERLRDAEGRPETGLPEPLTYYYFGGPISEAIVATRKHMGTLERVGAVGLGTGSLACHRIAREEWTFFEIDPQVIRIARDPSRFRFLSACAPDLPIVLGDARLTLAATSARYNLIVLDAFSSDVVPVHLLTREALAGYLQRLAPGGVIVAHLSNRHMDLSDVMAATGAQAGLVAYGKTDVEANSFMSDFRANARVVVLARRESDLGELPGQPGWRKLDPDPGIAAWTDDYSDIIQAIVRSKFKS